MCFLLAVTHILVIGTVFSGVNHVVYSEILDEKRAEEQNTPYLHWIMMGAQGNGSYSVTDYEFTRSYSDKKELQKALLDEISTRYKDMGISGVLNLWRVKSVKCFGDGSLALSDFFDDQPQKSTKLHEWIVYSGQNFSKYHLFCNGVFFLFLLLMFLGALESFSKENAVSADMRVLWLTFFGVWLFLMLWETSARYYTNHLSSVLVAAIYGFRCLDTALKRFWDGWKKRAVEVQEAK